jgi:uncharacterized protein (TIGR00369 family)
MDDAAAQLNQASAGNFASTIGLVFESATKDRVVGSVEIEARHLQPAGIVHGGVYCTIVESLASMAAPPTCGTSRFAMRGSACSPKAR